MISKKTLRSIPAMALLAVAGLAVACGPYYPYEVYGEWVVFEEPYYDEYEYWYEYEVEYTLAVDLWWPEEDTSCWDPYFTLEVYTPSGESIDSFGSSASGCHYTEWNYSPSSGPMAHVECVGAEYGYYEVRVTNWSYEFCSSDVHISVDGGWGEDGRPTNFTRELWMEPEETRIIPVSL